MTQAAKFDEQTHWDQDPGGLRAGGAGWAPPGADFFIDRADPYWGTGTGQGAARLRRPNMHFNTDSVWQERLLVFGDGTPVPRRRVAGLSRRGQRQDVSAQHRRDRLAAGPNGQAGQPIPPAGFGGPLTARYAPIDSPATK